jgi:hypothetical protein
MILPLNGKVVVIDDDKEEGLKLLTALSKHDVAAKYFTGIDVDELPPEPLTDVRVVFFDIVLGTAGQPQKTKISKAIGVLKKIIDISQPIPYILFAWTKESVLIEGLLNGLGDNKPWIIIDLVKIDCKNEEGEYEVSLIEKKLGEKSDELKSLKAFFLWESLVNKSAGKIFNDFTTFYSNDDDWDNNLKGILHRLATAKVGSDRIESMEDKEKLREAFLIINSTFNDTLERNFKKDDLVEIGKIEQKSIAPLIVTKINTKLHMLADDEINDLQTGNLYIHSNRNHLIEKIIDKNAKNNKKQEIKDSKPKLVELDITPGCDYSQDKDYVRLLSGILVKKIVKKKFLEYFKDTGFNFVLCPIMRIDGEDSYLLFDFRFVKSIPKEELINRKTKPKYMVRKELLVDIQAGLSHHINRPGFISLNYQKP